MQEILKKCIDQKVDVRVYDKSYEGLLERVEDDFIIISEDKKKVILAIQHISAVKFK